MNRADDLILKSLDAPLSSEELAELDLLRRDPATAERCALLLEVEGALRGERRLPDLGGAVLAQLQRERTERIMKRVRATAPAWKRSFPTWTRVAAAAALFVAALLGGVLRESPLARVLEGDPDAFFVRGSASLKAVDGLALRAGDVLLTCSRDLVIQYEGESTRVRVVPLSEIELGGDRRGKRIELRQGELEAEVAPQESPLVITAAHAKAEVLGTKLRMSATPEATRLEVETGKVRFTRKGDGAALLVSAKQFTVASPDQELIACELEGAGGITPEITCFSLLAGDAGNRPLPGYEELTDGAVISLSKLPTRRLNLGANTWPERVGSVRFSTAEKDPYNTEMIWPYTLIPGDARAGWNLKPGRHVVTAVPFIGSYGNGRRGEPRSLTLTITE